MPGGYITRAEARAVFVVCYLAALAAAVTVIYLICR